MSKDGDYSVVPRDGGWAAVGHGNSRASSLHSTQADAYAAARDYSANRGGGEILIQGRDGQIRDKNTIAPARDPRDVKG
ncbi:Uncharacterised protein [Mycobacteroides abscessus subsp. abscessus]|nr:Uncharacterised protein [Mycobacteroides abscessus subsp. abscessus]